MLDAREIAEDLKALRERHYTSSRGFAQASGISREIARKIESGEREATIPEIGAWLKACREDPARWLSRIFQDEALAQSGKDDVRLYRLFRTALRRTERRRAIAALLDAFAAEDEASRRALQ